jgi:hypothetical protein
VDGGRPSARLASTAAHPVTGGVSPDPGHRSLGRAVRGVVVQLQPRVLVVWTSADAVQVLLTGGARPPLVETLERVLDDLIRLGGRHLRVDLTRLQGCDVPVLEMLAAVSHRLRWAGGCLHVDGLERRLVSAPEVSWFPELFGEVAAPRPAGTAGCVAGAR